MKKLIIIVILLTNIITQVKADNNTIINQTETFIEKYDFSVKTQKVFYKNEEKILYEFSVPNLTHDYIIEYEIFDINNNSVKAARNTTNMNQKSFTPKIIQSEKAFIIVGKIDIDCNCTYNNRAEKVIIVNNDDQIVEGGQSDPHIEISTKGNPFSFGDVVNVDIEVNKGDSSKQVLELYIIDNNNKKISEVTKIKILDKRTDNKLTVPIQLKSLCELEPGTYYIKAEGLDMEAITKIEIIEYGNICKEIAQLKVKIPDQAQQEVKETKKEESQNNEKITTINPKQLPKLADEVEYEVDFVKQEKQDSKSAVLYESSSKKSEKLVVYLLISILVVIIAILILKD